MMKIGDDTQIGSGKCSDQKLSQALYICRSACEEVAVKALIIAEVGVNHNGDLGIARRLIEAAADANADLVKFQTFVASDLATPSLPRHNIKLAHLV